jgi:hypothetical protein
MKRHSRKPIQDIAHLVPREPFGPDVRASSPFALIDDGFDYGNLICAGLEELSRHLKRLDLDYQEGHLDRLEARASHRLEV